MLFIFHKLIDASNLCFACVLHIITGFSDDSNKANCLV